ncbi:MAG: AbrB/MazE/SpoVT family DNA-binding domain-containing protein [Nostoc sp.]
MALTKLLFCPKIFILLAQKSILKKIGNAIALIAKDNPWRSLIDSLDNFFDDFMINCDRLLMDTRDSWVE